MGKRKLVGKVFIVFILLILPVLNIQAFGFNFDNFQNKHETRKEYFSRMLDKMCAVRIKINQKHPRFPVPRICKTENLNPPTLEFYAEPASIIEGESSVLNWAEVDPPTSCVDINTASKEELDEIINIGPATADKIIAYRQTTPFTSVGDLINISGIGEVTLNEIIAQGKACVLNP